MNKEQRQARVIAKGEHSNHSHVVVGDATITKEGNKTFVEVPTEGTAVLKHILESEWVNNGSEVWTKEHTDIPLEAGKKYEFVQQTEYDPYEDKIREVRD